jgi:hypothetical protein
MGNKAKSCTENDRSANTLLFNDNREASSTDANMAAFTDRESGNSMNLRVVEE